MKNLISVFILVVLFSLPCFGATYYAQGDGNINAVEWDTSAAGGGSDLTWGNLDPADILYANNHAITVNVSFTCAKISTAAGDGTAGGSFNVVTNATPLTVAASIEAGTTPCLVVTGDADANPALTINAGTGGNSIQGGSAAYAYGVSDTHTVGTVVVTGNPTGGSNATARGYYFGGATGAVTLTGNATGSANSNGYYSASSGTTTITGNVTGGTGSKDCQGAVGGGAGAVTIIGNLIFGTRAGAVGGTITWSPVAPDSTHNGNYVQFTVGTDVYAGSAPAGDDASKVLSGSYFVKSNDGVTTQGTATAGGSSGGAYGF